MPAKVEVRDWKLFDYDQRGEPIDETADEIDRIHSGLVESAVPFLDWAMSVPEPKRPLDFVKFPFQLELYGQAFTNDDEGVVKKATQVGISAWLVRWLMFMADIYSATALYVQPKDKFLGDFSNQRIKPLILGSDYLRTRVPYEHVNNVHQRQIGGGWVNLRGSGSKDSLDAVDADVLGLDEYDTLVQANIPDAERRVTSPTSRGLIRRVGVPSIPDFGISRLYDQSDQRRWNVRCEHCKVGWQSLEWPQNVDQESAQIICSGCARPLDVATGEWVATHPDRQVRGYHVTRLMVPRGNIRRIIEASKKRSPFEVQTFWNKDLGLEYAPAEGRLTDAAIQAATREFALAPGYVGPEFVSMGVDVASARNLNVRISIHDQDLRTRRALFIGEAESFDEVALLMDRYDVKMAAVDEAPEMRLARSLAERFAGRIYLVRYASGQKDVLSIDEDIRRISVRRVEAIDATLESVRAQRNLLPLNPPEGYVSHLKNVTRRVERDEMGRVTTVYIETGPVDYLMSEVYDMLAKEAWLVRLEIEEASRQELSSLDEHLEFERTSVHDPENSQYSEGPSDDEFFEGPEADEF